MRSTMLQEARPFEAWLLHRGLRTLPARMREHQRTADIFIDRLSEHPEVTQVHSPTPMPCRGGPAARA